MKIVGWLMVVFGAIGIPGNLSQAISGEGSHIDWNTGKVEREPNTSLVRGRAIGGLAAQSAAVGLGVWLINGGPNK